MADRIESVVGDTTTSGAVTATIAELAIPDGWFGIVSIDITCEEDGTPANSYIVQNTYAVSGEGGAATIRDATAVPLEQDAGAVGMGFLFNVNGQNVRIRGVGVAATDLIWAGHIGALLHER